MTTDAPALTARRWRSRRSAAIAGIIFAVLLLTALTMMRIALSEDSVQALQSDAQPRSLIRLSLHLIPFAGIAFLWFIGVVRDQVGEVEDRLFSWFQLLFPAWVLLVSVVILLVRPPTRTATPPARSDENPDRHMTGNLSAQCISKPEGEDRFPNLTHLA